MGLCFLSKPYSEHTLKNRVTVGFNIWIGKSVGSQNEIKEFILACVPGVRNAIDLLQDGSSELLSLLDKKVRESPLPNEDPGRSATRVLNHTP